MHFHRIVSQTYRHKKISLWICAYGVVPIMHQTKLFCVIYLIYIRLYPELPLDHICRKSNQFKAFISMLKSFSISVVLVSMLMVLRSVYFYFQSDFKPGYKSEAETNLFRFN